MAIARYTRNWFSYECYAKVGVQSFHAAGDQAVLRMSKAGYWAQQFVSFAYSHDSRSRRSESSSDTHTSSLQTPQQRVGKLLQTFALVRPARWGIRPGTSAGRLRFQHLLATQPRVPASRDYLWHTFRTLYASRDWQAHTNYRVASACATVLGKMKLDTMHADTSVILSHRLLNIARVNSNPRNRENVKIAKMKMKMKKFLP